MELVLNAACFDEFHQVWLLNGSAEPTGAHSSCPADVCELWELHRCHVYNLLTAISEDTIMSAPRSYLVDRGIRALRRSIAACRQLVNDMIPRRGEYFTPAYAHHLSHRLPLLYAVVIVGIVTVSVSFTAVAPLWLSSGIALLLIAFLSWRAFHWLPQNVVRRTVEQLQADISNLTTIGPAGALAVVLWALSLEQFGDTNLDWLIRFAIAVTWVSAILGLGQSPIAALRIAVCVLVPSTVYFIIDGQPYAYAMAALQAVMAVLLLFVTASYHRDFVRLELSRQRILVQERDAFRSSEIGRSQTVLDPLTRTLNRRGIFARLDGMLEDDRSSCPWLALLDLDGFRHVNDTYGHAVADAVLQEIPRRIAKVPEIVAFGRVAGDEFMLLLSGDLSRARVKHTLENLRGLINEPIIHQHQTLRVTCSIGLRRTIPGGMVAECLERAQSALRKAKDERCGLAEFSSQDERAIQETRATARILYSSDLASHIGVYYQPIVDSDTGRAVGFEALARWTPDGRSWLPPDKLIAVAESTGRTGELTRTVMRKALAECRAWHYGRTLSINLSARDVLSERAAEWIEHEVIQADAPPDAVILEVTETALLNDVERAASNLRNLRSRGFRIALDDFGTGQSSLSHIHQLPLDHIKIDRSFARNLIKDASARAIAGTVLSLAQQLRLGCTFEGIETPEQRIMARRLGARLMQGFLFSRPLPAADALHLLQRAG